MLLPGCSRDRSNEGCSVISSIWTARECNQGRQATRPQSDISSSPRTMRSQRRGRVARRESSFERVVERLFPTVDLLCLGLRIGLARTVLLFACHGCFPHGGAWRSPVADYNARSSGCPGGSHARAARRSWKVPWAQPGQGAGDLHIGVRSPYQRHAQTVTIASRQQHGTPPGLGPG